MSELPHECPHVTPLRLPSFLHGSHTAIKRKAAVEGRRCAKQLQLSGSFPQPRELLAVAPGEVVFTHGIADLEDERPAWRLYLYWEVITSLCEASDEKHYQAIRDSHEAFFRETPWGALYFVTSALAPESAQRTSARLGAVLRAWDSLQHGRYQYKTLGALLGLEELLSATHGWTLDAWCPEATGPLRSRLEVASARMARATREDCIEAILRQLPHVLPLAQPERLSHPDVVTRVPSWREHLSTLEASAFERISGARPAALLERLYLWDRTLGAT